MMKKYLGPLIVPCVLIEQTNQDWSQPPHLELAQLLDPPQHAGPHRQPRRRGAALPGACVFKRASFHTHTPATGSLIDPPSFHTPPTQTPKARVMAALVDVPALRRVHAKGGTAIPDVGGWDHAPFREAVREAQRRAECDEDRCGWWGWGWG